MAEIDLPIVQVNKTRHVWYLTPARGISWRQLGETCVGCPLKKAEICDGASPNVSAQFNIGKWHEIVVRGTQDLVSDCKVERLGVSS